VCGDEVERAHILVHIVSPPPLPDISRLAFFCFGVRCACVTFPPVSLLYCTAEKLEV
jgi:hypothetical protein